MKESLKVAEQLINTIVYSVLDKRLLNTPSLVVLEHRGINVLLKTRYDSIETKKILNEKKYIPIHSMRDFIDSDHEKMRTNISISIQLLNMRGQKAMEHLIAMLGDTQ